MADRTTHNKAAISRPDNAVSGGQFLPTATRPQELPDGPIAIADMANLFGVTHRTLHFYEEKGLIRADRIGLMRVYLPKEVQRMACINTCREIGMPVAVIQDLMAELGNASTQDRADGIFETALLARRRELASEQSTIQRQLNRIERLLTGLDVGEDTRPQPKYTIDLTAQERRCLQLMAEGYAPLRLARALELTSTEIAALEMRIITKFGASNRFQAVAKAVLLGIVAS